MLITIILAGGEGKRMNSDIPKVLHLIKNKPMIFYVIEKAMEINSDKIFIIVGKHENEIKHAILAEMPTEYNRIVFVRQVDALGTGDAIKQCLPYTKSFLAKVLILSADVPSIGIDTLNELVKYEHAVLTHVKDTPFGCGRILLDNYGKIMKIVEEKDCSELEKMIRLINCGIYVCTMETMQLVNQIQNKNAANEYYLTDLIEIAYNSGHAFESVELSGEKSFEFFNINTQEELRNFEKLFCE
jgi:hypothetical protein